jgi:hypothetical protein
LPLLFATDHGNVPPLRYGHGEKHDSESKTEK